MQQLTKLKTATAANAANAAMAVATSTIMDLNSFVLN